MTEARPVRPHTDPQPPARRRRRAVLILILVAVLVLLADIGTKQWALSALTPDEPVRLLGGAVWLSLLRNSGAAWSLGAGHTWVFPIITLAVIGWIGWMASRLRSTLWAVSLGLVLGGALGNFVDRIFRAPGVLFGHVVDMISLFAPYGEHFPVFNLADSSLCCGVALAVLLELTGHRRDGSLPHPVGEGDAAGGPATGASGDGPTGAAGGRA